MLQPTSITKSSQLLHPSEYVKALMPHPQHLPILSQLISFPSSLLETILIHLHASDLTSLLHAAPSSLRPKLETAVQNAARILLSNHTIGRQTLQTRHQNESYLDLLRHLHLLDNAASNVTAIYSCGRNDSGQGARHSTFDTNILLPTQPLFDQSPPISLSAGSYHSTCLTASGNLHVAGSNHNGQLALFDNIPRTAWTPVYDLAKQRVSQVACGAFHTVILTSRAVCMTAGANDKGQLALGDKVQRNQFSPTPTLPYTIRMIAAGNHHTVLLTDCGRVFAAGSNARGQLGTRNSDTSRTTFQPVGCFGRRVVRIACGSDTTMLLTADNMILVTGKRVCGLSVIGGLGLSTVTHLSVGNGFAIVSTKQNEVAVSANRKRFLVTDEIARVAAVAVSAGTSHYAIVTYDGRALAAGANAFGQVAAGEMGLTIQGGHDARIVRPHRVPLSRVQIPSGFRVVQAAAGAFHTLYLLAPCISEDG